MSAALESIVKDAIRWNTSAQFEGYLKIEDKTGELRRPTANVHQLRLNRVVQIAHETGQPCRIVALKPRQKGSSTGSMAIGHVRLKAKRCRGLVAGGKHFQGKNLFRMLEVFSKNDELDPKPCTVMDMEARYRSGSNMQRITLANGDAGRSGTYQFLCVTEAGFLAEEGVANADVVLDGLLKCVPLQPDTIIIVESTANGASGYFYDMWEAGISIEDFESGKSGYVRIFSAWFEFDDSRLEPSKMGIASRDDLTAEELGYEEEHGLTLDLHQFAWMRWALRDECKGDWDKFLQDYPADPETAFLKSGRGAFSPKGIEYQESLVHLRPKQFGVLAYNDRADRVSFVATAEDQAKCVRWEGPREGCRYLLSVDPMTGADQTGGTDPDSHSVTVHRAGYMQEGKWHESALVMRNILIPGKKPGSMVCWWNIDVLEEEVWRMSKYYGNCIIVPEMNMDRGLVELLKLRPDANIYLRELFNRRENTVTHAFGWMTDTKTRPMIIETLATAIRESGRGQVGVGYEMRCPWAVKQAKNFIVKPSGRAEAAAGHHDDDILGMAIGLQNIGHATPYFEERRAAWIPHHLQGTGARRVGSKENL